MQRLNEAIVDLQKGLATGEDNKAVRSIIAPHTRNCIGQLVGIGKPPAAKPVGADEVRVAEGTDGCASILLSSGPQIAARKAAEDGRPPGIAALALERIENLFDRICHVIRP